MSRPRAEMIRVAVAAILWASVAITLLAIVLGFLFPEPATPAGGAAAKAAAPAATTGAIASRSSIPSPRLSDLSWPEILLVSIIIGAVGWIFFSLPDLLLDRLSVRRDASRMGVSRGT